MDFRVTLKKSSTDDLRSISKYISAIDKRSASRLSAEITRVARSLSVMPYRGQQTRSDRNLRRITYKHYQVFYRINERRRLVEVVRVWDTRQHPTFHVRETGSFQASGSSA
jgi:plasmid stabilization system protein ParE